MNSTARVTEVIAFCSGKGGTGKTSLIAALGYALTYSGHSVLMIDADRATDGFSLFLLGPDGQKQLDRIQEQSTFTGLLSEFARTSQMSPRPQIIHRLERRDHQLSYEAIISGKGLYGDHRKDTSETLTEPWNQQFDRATFQAGVRELLNWTRNSGKYDYVLVDSRGGFSFESTDVVAAADSLILVTEAATTNFYQDRNLIDRINTAARSMGTRPLLRGIIVNKSVEPPELSFRNELNREFGIDVEDTFPVSLDVEAAKAYKTQQAIYLAAPASPFAFDSLKAFRQILRIVTNQWPTDRTVRWNALVESVDNAIAAHNATVEAEQQEEKRKVQAFEALGLERDKLLSEVRTLNEALEQEKQRQNKLFEELNSQSVRRDQQVEAERAETRARFNEERTRQNQLIEQLQTQYRESDARISALREQRHAEELEAAKRERDLLDLQHRLEKELSLTSHNSRWQTLKTALLSSLVTAVLVAIAFLTIPALRKDQPAGVSVTPPPTPTTAPDRMTGPSMTDVTSSTPTAPDIVGMTEPPTNLDTASQWFKPCLKGTKNVIVASKFPNPESAGKIHTELARQFPHFGFEIAATVAPDQTSNRQYAIMAGHGLTTSEATALTVALQQAGKLPYGIYSTTQSRDAPCIAIGEPASPPR